MDLRDVFERAAAELRRAGALVVTAGAGMGVDSGLPDFRGDRGFWKAYPPYERLGLSFIGRGEPGPLRPTTRSSAGGSTATGRTCTGRPRRTRASGSSSTGRRGSTSRCFVVTSNVDGQFQKAGFPEERVLEVHGSIHHLQCTTPCSPAIWTNGETLEIELATMRSRQVPRCPNCGGGVAPEHPHVRRLLVAGRPDRRAAGALRGVPAGRRAGGGSSSSSSGRGRRSPPSAGPPSGSAAATPASCG